MYLDITYRQHTMKTLVVLTALVAVALAGPTFRATNLDITKEKRSPTVDHLHLLPSPSHLLPVHHHQHHQTYVQPIIPHHLGLKKPLIVSQPYGHHIFRSDAEEQETHSTEAKESKKTCMKEMEAKCEDEVSAKSSESDNNTKMEDIDESVSDGEVAMSLKMAKDAVEILQRKLELAEKNPKMAQWKHGNSEADGNMQENVQTAKQALEHMQRNFGNLESMNVHARQFKNAEVHDANLKLEHVFKDSKDLKSDEERLSQWKDAIENIKKNVELVRNIEDSFQQNEHSEKSAAIDQSLNHKLEHSSDLKEDAILPKEESDKRTSDMKISQDMEKMSADGKSSWQAHEHEKMRESDVKMSPNMEKKSLDGKSSWQAREDKHSFNSKNEMEASASMVSESKTTLHKSKHENEEALRSDNSLLEKSSDFTPASAAEHNELKKVIKPVESISQPTLKTSEDMEMKQAKQAHIEIEMDPPMVDTSNFMKFADHNQAEEHKQIEHHSSHGHFSHQEHALSSHDHHKMAEQHQAQQSSHMGNVVGSHLDHQKTLTSPLNDKDVHEIKLEKTQKELENILDQHKSSIPATHAKEAHDTMMKPSDQFTGQSQVVEVAVKPQQPVTSGHHSENLHHALSHGAHGKSAEGGSMFAPIGMNPDFKEALVPMKSWKEAQSARGAYGVGAALAGASSYGSGRGSGAVGVFPNARVGGCAIPLLLSCSPSVVAGHLAKSHSYGAPSYGASAYRGSEQLSSHSKRDITKISRSAQIKKSPYNKDLHQKTVFINDKH